MNSATQKPCLNRDSRDSAANSKPLEKGRFQRWLAAIGRSLSLQHKSLFK
ncbi:hypothetical protein [Shewanella algae]|nr:hypothetical protein [Shewanella algae]MBO2613328.1 hypothetical protein [Shewanella algae]MBO2689244.1 hypothetical protein [Shewanella algae]